jgi:catechol 2,3-dioxygenase-like lactoylglutathione lyase family enzyme
MAIEVLRLGHANLGVKDLLEARRFYIELLGLSELPRGAGAQRDGAWLRVGDCELHLSVETGSRETSDRHLAFQVASLSEVRAALQSAGMGITEGRPLPGLQRLFVRDPSGNLLELYERL